MVAPIKKVRPRRPLKWIALGVYVALLLASHLTRAVRPDHPDTRGVKTIEVQAIQGEQRLNQTARLAYEEYRPNDAAPALVLLHGSPGRGRDFAALAPELGKEYRVIIPDLPGFGASSRDVPDYSIRAHAYYVLQLLNNLRIERAHVLGFSMGGGVALHMADLAPERVISITMLSAIGVQEMEMLGDYHLNHAIHGLQLAGLWLLSEGTPHFGWLDDAIFGVPYARNFYDSDQRPLRDILARFNAPFSIIHGKDDVLVPVEAAREHYRLVPQSELTLFDENHFMVFTDGPKLASLVRDFVNRVERGEAKTRANADPERIARAALPYNPADAPKAMGVTALVLMTLIILATLVSEDLTSIGVGVMVAQGRVGYLFGAFSCFLGIFVGDVLLYLAGRYLGRPALKRGPLSWFIREDAVERSSRWFSRQGIAVIAASRFVPGMRLPTYFAAGMLNTNFWWFCLYFFLAGAVWTPLLVGLSAKLGGEVIRSTLFANQSLIVKALAAG
ncbi:MAG TPA: alpha/beta fold hydrolase, partial [Blastocatellia bacterium]|nr:alpha/beta fold hydrolase [Blastocatellia bacterium]